MEGGYEGYSPRIENRRESITYVIVLIELDLKLRSVNRHRTVRG